MNVLLTTNKDVMYYFHHDRFHDMPTDAKTQFVEEKVFLTSTYFIHKKGFWTCTECFLIKRRQFLVFRKFSLFWRLFHSFSYSFTGLLPKNVTCLVSWFLCKFWQQTLTVFGDGQCKQLQNVSNLLPQFIMKSFTSMLKRANIFSFFFSIFLRRNNI